MTAIGRPGILVPLPHALDQDQRANAGVLMEAGGAIRLAAGGIHPGPAGRGNRGAGRRARRGLPRMAAAAKSAGAIDAADRLADLVLRVAGVIPSDSPAVNDRACQR